VIQRSTPRSRLGLASAAVIALLVLSSGSVFADTSPGPSGDVKFSQNGKSAEASEGSCVPNGDDTETCTYDGISVFAGKISDSFSGVTHGSQVCAFHETYTYSEVTGDYVGEPVSEYGCAVDLAAGVLVFGTKLSTVTLHATTLSLQQYVCDEYSCEPGSSRNVTVAGTWTGVGPTFSGKYRSSGDDGVCRYADSGSGSSREATFAGHVGDVTLGADAFGYLNDGKSSYRSRCSEA
jgi:hypothetical protein